ncbi:hypothetical protein PFLUV_G00269820 [Perca fluviatilis]|uniref:Uncharacterized protein n=1 Tax=Perca fluviatilis TaxID=8168 RepID=A0A6A5DMN5_PERFL|nr:hypothetical protein PFLUV_G00269820 [Perca fluviatilis]
MYVFLFSFKPSGSKATLIRASICEGVNRLRRGRGQWVSGSLKCRDAHAVDPSNSIQRECYTQIYIDKHYCGYFCPVFLGCQLKQIMLSRNSLHSSNSSPKNVNCYCLISYYSRKTK